MSDAPVMADPIDEVRAKLRRAREHEAAWNTLRDRWVNENAYSFEWEIDHHRCRYRIRLREHIPPPIDLSLIYADEIFNLRAALDHLVCHIVGAACDRDTYFPVIPKRENWKSAVNGMLKGFPRQHVGIVESFQPFQYGDRADRHPLRIIDHLNNRGKHRLLVPIALASVELKVPLKFNRDLRTSEMFLKRKHDQGVFRDGAVIFDLQVLNAQEDLRAIIFPDDLDVTMGWGPPTGLYIGRLPNLCAFVDSVIEALSVAL